MHCKFKVIGDVKVQEETALPAAEDGWEMI